MNNTKQETAQHTATLTIVPESATHIAFVNGKTYSREEILLAVNVHDELLAVAKNKLACIDRGDDHGEYIPLLNLIARAEGK